MKNYFKHDLYAREDEKLINLVATLGHEGLGLFWCIIEMIHENGGWLALNYQRIAFALRTDCDRIKRIINDFDLFEVVSEKFTNRRALEQVNLLKSVSEKARKSVNIRWKKRNTNVLPTQYEGNTASDTEKRR